MEKNVQNFRRKIEFCERLFFKNIRPCCWYVRSQNNVKCFNLSVKHCKCNIHREYSEHIYENTPSPRLLGLDSRVTRDVTSISECGRQQSPWSNYECANNTGIRIYTFPYYCQTDGSPVQMQHYDYKRDESNCACMPISILIIAKPRMRMLFVLNDHLHAVTSLIRTICRSKIISIASS